MDAVGMWSFVYLVIQEAAFRGTEFGEEPSLPSK
jgi:hypothetical protein